MVLTLRDQQGIGLGVRIVRADNGAGRNRPKRKVATQGCAASQLFRVKVPD